jgi:hypothetical protein
MVLAAQLSRIKLYNNNDAVPGQISDSMFILSMEIRQRLPALRATGLCLDDVHDEGNTTRFSNLEFEGDSRWISGRDMMSMPPVIAIHG